MTTHAVEEVTAARGARWFATAGLTVGALNYAYALILTRILGVGEYARFGAGQGLLLWVSSTATASVPWVLAQSLARAHTDAERADATRFALVTSAAAGIFAGVAVGAVGAQFMGPRATWTLAISALVIFLGTTTVGALQGRERIRALATLTFAEGVLKVGAGVLLVMFGLREAGALAAFGIAAVLPLLWLPAFARHRGHAWRTALINRDLWRRALGIASVQSMVMIFVAVDLVLVPLLPMADSDAASYQASAALSRVPLFVAAAVSAAYFPSLSRRQAAGPLTSSAVRMYAVITLPLVAILATAPGQLVTMMFPSEYGAMTTLLRFTALAGLAAGGINLASTFFQATNDYSCLWWQGAGLVGYVGALVTGWSIGGVHGLAVAAAIGAFGALALLVLHFLRRHGSAVLAGIPWVGPAAAAGVLVLLRPHPLAWLVVATSLGLYTTVRFMRGTGTSSPSPSPSTLTPEHA